MPGKEPLHNMSASRGPAAAPVDYSNFYKTTGLMASFTFFMSAGRLGRTANVVARAGFLYGLHQIGKEKEAEQTTASTATVVPASVEKAIGKMTSLFFQPEKPSAEMGPERIISKIAKATDTIFIGGGEVVNKIYRP
jgi:hypothetical protein